MDQPNYTYMGTWTEIGMAISSGITILMFNPINNCSTNVYFNHPLIKQFNNLNDIAEYLKR